MHKVSRSQFGRRRTALVHQRQDTHKDVRLSFKDREYIWKASGSLVRIRTKAEGIRDMIRRELRRCGWATRKLRITERHVTDGTLLEIEVAMANALSGLSAGWVLKVLRSLPSHCGQKVVIGQLAKGLAPPV